MPFQTTDYNLKQQKFIYCCSLLVRNDLAYAKLCHYLQSLVPEANVITIDRNNLQLQPNRLYWLQYVGSYVALRPNSLRHSLTALNIVQFQTLPNSLEHYPTV